MGAEGGGEADVSDVCSDRPGPCLSLKGRVMPPTLTIRDKASNRSDGESGDPNLPAGEPSAHGSRVKGQEMGTLR